MLKMNPILETEKGKVTLKYGEMPDFKLQMDFNPIIDRFRLQGRFCILHWQAKPFGERRWGIYDGGADEYVSVKHSEVHVTIIPRLLQVDEILIKTVPTAVLYFPNSKLVKESYYEIISA